MIPENEVQIEVLLGMQMRAIKAARVGVGSKVKASVATQKRALNSITRHGLACVGDETKKELVEKLRALQSMNAVKKYLMVGSNTVAKAMEAGNVAVLVVPKDSPAAVVNHLIESAMWNKIHVLVVPKFVAELREIFKLRSASCFAIPTKVSIRPSKAKNTKKDESEVDEDVTSSRVDAFKEYCTFLES